ncbi:MAG: restriction endonuclease, partial [Clostridia bacterium]|nr:restriction endonuclease [Clostridia bacterium]
SSDLDRKLTTKEKRQLTEEEKEYKSKRKAIQEKLIKFATRIPVFMYLTDFREYSLKDVITQLEPGLFKKVTGLEVKDFELLVSLGVFNGPLMSDAIYKFKRYEDSSLSYTGINKHEGEDVGLWDTTISYYEYMNTLQQTSMTSQVDAFKGFPDVPYPDNDESDNKAEDEKRVIKHIKSKKDSIEKDNIHQKENIKRKTAATVVPFAKLVKQTHQSTKAAEYNMDYTHVKVGTTLTHKKFGEGIVIAFIDDMIAVSFSGAEKKFMFPDAFKDGYLQMN